MILRDSARSHDKVAPDPGAEELSFSFEELRAALDRGLDPDVQERLERCDTALLYERPEVRN